MSTQTKRRYIGGSHRKFKQGRAEIRPALLATVVRTADTNQHLHTYYEWAVLDDEDQPTPCEPAGFFSSIYGHESDPDEILYLFHVDLRLDCPVIVRQGWI
jgi:hypothetical protein